METFKTYIEEKLEEAKKVGCCYIEIDVSEEEYTEWIEDHCRFKVVGTSIDLYSFPPTFNVHTTKSVLLYNLYKKRETGQRFVNVYLSPAQIKECMVKGLDIESHKYRVYNLI